MNSKKMLRRFAIGHVACQIESLESRQMLATDLLISNYDDASGTSVYRYNDTTWNPAAGSVPASAASTSAPKRARIAASKASLLTNHSRRAASGGAPNQKASASAGVAAISSPP